MRETLAVGGVLSVGFNLMKSSLLRPALFLFAVSLVWTVPQLSAKKKPAAKDDSNAQKRAVHALNRLTFGPRPDDVQKVMAMGVDQWIDQQLHPEKISDSALDARLASFRTLHMSSREIVEEFPDNQMIKQVMEGKKPMPSDPARRAIFQVQIARMEEKKERKEEKAESKAEAAATTPPASAPVEDSTGSAKTAEELAAAAAASPDAKPATAADANLASVPAGASAMSDTNTETASPAAETQMASANEAPMTEKMDAKTTSADDLEARRREERLYADLEVQKEVEKQVGNLADLSPDQRYRKVLSMSVDDQVAFADSLKGGKGRELLAGMDPKQRETLLAMNSPQSVVSDELMQAKLLRVVYSERQLEQVMTDFWFNHFNVFLNKGADRVLLTDYEQNVIRPRAMGKFEDLLVATAKSPAMLFYLDNWLSVGPDSMQALGMPAHPGARGPYGYRRFPGPGPNPNARRKQNNGLNENYGRELLELHTLSVNGGYSQRDVTEVAKVFTGWTIDKPFEGGGFLYDPRKHEPGPKFVLGHKIKPKGEDEGREVLHMLATSPQTAHFISLKLAQRFVSDDPSPALVDRMAKTFQKKKGDMREVLSTLFHSPEFWDDSAYRAKVKTPLEFVASAVRATGADVDDAMPLVRQIGNMGMPLYQAQPPTGYSMKAETWVSSSSLLNRMNFALALTAGKVRGVKVDVDQLARLPQANPPNGGSPASPDAALELSTMEAKLLTADVSKQTHDSIVAQLHGDAGSKSKPPAASLMAGLLLGSPEFQRR